MQTWTFPSSSSAKVYTTTRSDDGLLSCTCPGWINKRGDKPRECKHTKKIVQEVGSGITGLSAEQVIVDDPFMLLEAMNASAMTPALWTHGTPTWVLQAKSGTSLDSSFEFRFGDGLWAMEEKLDGHRVLVRKRGDVLTKKGSSSVTLPSHIEAALKQMPDGIYDGEFLIPGGISTDVPNLASRHELQLALFDVIETGGVNLVERPYDERREILVDCVWFCGGDPSVIVVQQYPPTLESVRSIWARGGEGAILKNRWGIYRPGDRSADWVKVKGLEQHVVTVTGFEKGLSGPTGITLFIFDDGTRGRCKTLNNEELAATSANPQTYVGRRLMIQCQLRTRDKAPRHPMWDHWAGDAE